MLDWQEYAISHKQLRLLRIVKENPGLTAMEVYQRIDPSEYSGYDSVIRSLRSLEERGMLQRVWDKARFRHYAKACQCP